jgi:hypothetical protein
MMSQFDYQKYINEYQRLNCLPNAWQPQRSAFLPTDKKEEEPNKILLLIEEEL